MPWDRKRIVVCLWNAKETEREGRVKHEALNNRGLRRPTPNFAFTEPIVTLTLSHSNVQWTRTSAIVRTSIYRNPYSIQRTSNTYGWVILFSEFMFKTKVEGQAHSRLRTLSMAVKCPHCLFATTLRMQADNIEDNREKEWETGNCILLSSLCSFCLSSLSSPFLSGYRPFPLPLYHVHLFP